MIPSIIHQTWKTHDVPEPLAKFQARWRALHPEFEYRLWSDDDNDAFVRREYPELLQLYRSFSRGIYRADMVRCLYLHHFGGVYVDLDVEPLRPLAAFLAQGGDCVLGAEPEAHARKRRGQSLLACNAVMASVPRHEFWLRMIEQIREGAARPGGEPVGVTGPLALHAAYERHGAALGVSISSPDAFFPLPDLDAQSLPIDARARKHFRTMRELALYPAASYGVHHWAHTWIPEAGLNRAVQRAAGWSRDSADVLRGEKTVDELLRAERYKVTFPEQVFAPRPVQVGAYQAALARGQKLAKTRSITILTMLRDRLDLALLLRARLEALLGLFGSGRVLVLCEDSSDGTERVLGDWARARPGVVTSLPVPPLPQGLSGFRRMARLRNALCQAGETAPSDLVAVLDGDLEGPVSLDGVAHTVDLLCQDGGPDAAAAFGINNWVGLPLLLPFLGYGYYDPIAFRERAWPRLQGDAAIRARLARLRRGDAPLPVKSAFAGLALYRSEAIRGLRYDEQLDDCEHVGFHRALAARGGKLVLSPSLMLLAGRQGHHRQKSA